MNLSEIRTQSMRRYSEQSTIASYILAADWNDFINEGIKEICIKGLVFKRSKTATVLNNVAIYTFPFDCIQAEAILNPSGISLDVISPQDAGRRFIVTGKPLYYYLSQSLATYTARQNLTAYAACDLVTPVTANGYMYECVIAGNSGGAPPVYPTSWGNRVVDGSVTWACREMFTSLWMFTLVDTPTTAGGGTGTYTLVYSGIDEGLFVDTDSPNIPIEKHPLLCSYACYRACLKSGDKEKALVFITEFARGLGLDVAAVTGEPVK